LIRENAYPNVLGVKGPQVQIPVPEVAPRLRPDSTVEDHRAVPYEDLTGGRTIRSAVRRLDLPTSPEGGIGMHVN
jgi:hypothetical protein